jgi:hypothetical protein
MGLTGKFKFRKSLWGKIIHEMEEEVKPFWSRSKPGLVKRRWRDATLMDLAAPEMRHLIDMRCLALALKGPGSQLRDTGSEGFDSR